MKSLKYKIDPRAVAAFAVYFFMYFAPLFQLSFTSMYMTDVLHFRTDLVATSLLLARIFDVIISAICGSLIQKINPSRGKRDRVSAWADLVGIAALVTMILLYMDTSALPGGVWITGLWYALFSGVTDIQTGVVFCMIGNMSRNDINSRNSMTIATSRAAKIAGIVSGFCTLPILQFFESLFPGYGYMIAGGIFGFGVFIGMRIFRRCYDRYNVCPDDSLEENDLTFKQIFSAMIGNEAFRTVQLADIAYYIGLYISTGLTVYYFKLMGSFDSTYSLIRGLISVAGTVGAFIMPRLGLKLGKKKARTVWFLVYGAGVLSLAFVGDRSVWIYGVVMAVGQLLFTMWFFYQSIYLFDSAEYYLYKTGIDTRIAVSSTSQISNDIGGAIGGALAGYGLTIVGYDGVLSGEIAVNTAFMHKFLLLYGISGFLVLVGAFIWIRYYRITDEDAEFYRKENLKRAKERETPK